MELMAMFNLLDVNDKQKSLKKTKSNVVRIK